MVPKSVVNTDGNVCNVVLVDIAFVFDACSLCKIILVLYFFFDYENTKYLIGLAKTHLAEILDLFIDLKTNKHFVQYERH